VPQLPGSPQAILEAVVGVTRLDQAREAAVAVAQARGPLEVGIRQRPERPGEIVVTPALFGVGAFEQPRCEQPEADRFLAAAEEVHRGVVACFGIDALHRRGRDVDVKVADDRAD